MVATTTRIDVATYREMVQAALLAPSAENTQPWKFIFDGRCLTICLDTTRQLSSDIDRMLDLTSLGACTENAVIGAREAGYEPTVELVTEPTMPPQDDTACPWFK